MAAAKTIHITNYVNGTPTVYRITDPVNNILLYDYVDNSSLPTEICSLEIWIKHWPKSPLVMQFPSQADRSLFKDMLTMAITGIYYQINPGEGSAPYTPAEDAHGVFYLRSNIMTSAPTTTTTTQPPATTTTTAATTSTTTASGATTTTTTLFAPTLHWSYTKTSGVSASFRIYKNGTAVVTQGSSSSGTLAVTAGDSVYAVLAGTTSVLKTIDLTGGASGTTYLDTVSGTGSMTLPTFTVTAGNNYHIDGTAEPAA